jgi:ADP-ribose pyrophosphatase YjhB (NUDIX family)
MFDADPEQRHGTPAWLEWTRRLQSIAQTGLTYARDPYDIERYGQIRRLAAEIGAAGTGVNSEAIEGFFAAERGYPTPKIDVRACVIVDDRILFVCEQDDGQWSMPGGWADVGESAAEAAVRETREEAGLHVRATKLVALYERERRGHPLHPEFSYKAFFACQPCGGALSGSSSSARETSAAKFFPFSDLPRLSLQRITAQEVALAFAHHRNPELPTEFD